MGSRQGLAEEVALSLCTVPGLKEFQLFLSFNAFCNHALLQILAHANDGAHHGRVIGVGGDLVGKGFVNLQDVDGKLLEIAEAGIAGAEVIHCNVYSHRLKRLKFDTRQIGMLHFRIGMSGAAVNSLSNVSMP